MEENSESIKKEGFLIKEGINFKTWKRRWITLDRSGVITYFNNETKKKELGKFLLLRNSTIEVNHSKQKKFCFSIQSSDREYYFCASTNEEMEEWIIACQQMKVKKKN